MTNTPSGNPDSNAVDPNDVTSVPQSAPDAPQSAPDAQAAPELSDEVCKWWLMEQAGLSQVDADELMNIVTDNGNKPIMEKRFRRACQNKANDIGAAGGTPFAIPGTDEILQSYSAAHSAPTADAVDSNSAGVDPNAVPANPNAPASTIPGEPATPDLTQGMPVTSDPNAPATDPNAATPDVAANTDQPDFAPMPPIGGPAVDFTGKNSGNRKLDPFIIAGVIGLAAAATIYGVSKSKGCNEGSSETGAVATASASASSSPTAKPTATATTAPTATASAKPKDPSWVVKNKPAEVWVKCDNSSVPTNCTLPEDCRMNGVSLSRPASFECAGADGKWITYATPFKAEHTYPHGKAVELKFKLQD